MWPFTRTRPTAEADHLSDAVAEVRTELGRADSKASMLLALAGAGVAVVASTDLITGTEPAAWIVRAGLALLVGAVVVLLSTVRPKLAGAPFMRANAADWRPETPEERMRNLATVAAAKFRRIRLAVDLTAGGVVAIGAGGALVGVA